MQTAILGHLPGPDASDTIAANSVAMTFYQYLKVVVSAMASATAVVMGQTVGRGNMKRIRSDARTISVLNLCVGIVLAVLLFISIPLLKNRDVYGSKKILMNFYFNPNSEAPLIMEEMNEIQEFMANFDPDLDVIWGTAFDETLSDQIKVTVLAAGFNVSLDKEAPVSQYTSSSQREPMPLSPAMSDDSRIKQEYGDKAFNEFTLKQLSARYVVLTPDEMDDDDVIDLMEKTPAYKRRSDIRSQIKERQHASSQDRPVEVPKVTPKRNGSVDSQTIDFGEN